MSGQRIDLVFWCYRGHRTEHEDYKGGAGNTTARGVDLEPCWHQSDDDVTPCRSPMARVYVAVDRGSNE